jgi:hypothetical protein
MVESEKLIGKFIALAAADLEGHKAALDRLAANQEAQSRASWWSLPAS